MLVPCASFAVQGMMQTFLWQPPHECPPVRVSSNPSCAVGLLQQQLLHTQLMHQQALTEEKEEAEGSNGGSGSGSASGVMPGMRTNLYMSSQSLSLASHGGSDNR